MKWIYLWCVLVMVRAKTELELNVEQNVDNCFTETFGFSESSWNNINAQQNFVESLQNCLKVKNMLQISDEVLSNVNKIAGNLTLEARNVNVAIVLYTQFSESFYTGYVERLTKIIDFSESLSSKLVESYSTIGIGTPEQRSKNLKDYLELYITASSNGLSRYKILINALTQFVNDNLPIYQTYLKDYNDQEKRFEEMLEQKDEVKQLILQNALSHVNSRLTRQRFDANCIPGQAWLTCTNDFQHVDECYRPARIYHNNQIFAVNSSIEIAEPSFCLSNELCVYTPRGFKCSTTGSEIPNVVYHSSNGFGRAYDILHRYGMFDISFFTLNKLKRLGVQEMEVEQLGTIDEHAFNQYIFEMYDQLE